MLLTLVVVESSFVSVTARSIPIVALWPTGWTGTRRRKRPRRRRTSVVRTQLQGFFRVQLPSTQRSSSLTHLHEFTWEYASLFPQTPRLIRGTRQSPSQHHNRSSLKRQRDTTTRCPTRSPQKHQPHSALPPPPLLDTKLGKLSLLGSKHHPHPLRLSLQRRPPFRLGYLALAVWVPRAVLRTAQGARQRIGTAGTRETLRTMRGGNGRAGGQQRPAAPVWWVVDSGRAVEDGLDGGQPFRPVADGVSGREGFRLGGGKRSLS